MSGIVSGALLLGGACTLVGMQWRRQNLCLGQLREFLAFVDHTRYVLRMEEIGMQEYMLEMAYRQRSSDAQMSDDQLRREQQCEAVHASDALTMTLLTTVALLREHSYPTGAQCWRAACEKRRWLPQQGQCQLQQSWCLPLKGWELLLAFGDVAFGPHLDEILHGLDLLQERIACVVQEEEKHREEMVRFTFPVEVMTGILLCVIQM